MQGVSSKTLSIINVMPKLHKTNQKSKQLTLKTPLVRCPTPKYPAQSSAPCKCKSARISN